jgi:hypothetical protein
LEVDELCENDNYLIIVARVISFNKMSAAFFVNKRMCGVTENENTQL